MKDSEIKLALKSAFSKEIQEAPQLSHSDCMFYRSNLPTLRTPDIKQFLPQVLMDLVDTHTNDVRNPEGVELLVQFLLPADISIQFLSPADISSLPEGEAQHCQSSMSEGQKYLAKSQHEIFDSFDTQQSAAIAKWLQFAANWKDLFFSREVVEEAIHYWTKRCQ